MAKSSPIIRSEIQELLEEPISVSNREAVLGFTIDGETSKDLDDAIWIQPKSSGVVIDVHISDVTAWVPIGSNLEEQAMSLVATRYMASRTEPMFPHELSEDKLSLLEDQLRLTVTIRVTLDESANIKKTQLLLTHFTSLKKFSYPSADATLNDPSRPFFQVLRYCEIWAQKLAWKRQSLGAIGQTTVGGVTLDEEGRLVETLRYHSQQIIQEFMILANTAVANLAEQHRLPLLYRNHTASAVAPKSKELIETLTTLGLPELIRQKLQSWLNPATYSPAVIGHFALSLPAYTHFTSPIRRIADYINHRILKAVFIDNVESPYTVEDLEGIAEYINEKRQEVKEKRDEHYREKRLSQTVNLLQKRGKLQGLSDKDFSKILKDSLKISKLDQMVPEAIARLEARELKPADLYYLVFGEYQDPENKALIKEKLLGYVEEQPAHATQTLQIASAINQTTLEYLEKTTASGKFAFWSVFEGETTSFPAIATSKQAAKHQANCLLLQGVFEQSLVPPRLIDESPLQDVAETESFDQSFPEELVEELDLSGVPEEARDSPIGYLHDHLQRLKLKKPAYFYNKVGDRWRCCCQVAWFEHLLLETEALASSKKEAKTMASLKAIADLEQYVVEELED
ncbi:RNB domain-containing ribonuclease [Crocosphaera sp. XPORK-15E]|uniref:RNB domain-containing ribonuclease n=1 Tax=Crocosphaera sp. XPORK-15E TaxID=3110247 RepID=UPI002B1F940A|nr:RNB domain-containing ribonuclease [Crocosphaera sp. XPORK-15E]MEA5532890.1 RNB domain-containing ribonuclease [Crocosphaera sp. XPORK-15E]